MRSWNKRRVSRERCQGTVRWTRNVRTALDINDTGSPFGESSQCCFPASPTRGGSGQSPGTYTIMSLSDNGDFLIRKWGFIHLFLGSPYWQNTARSWQKTSSRSSDTTGGRELVVFRLRYSLMCGSPLWTLCTAHRRTYNQGTSVHYAFGVTTQQYLPSNSTFRTGSI